MIRAGASSAGPVSVTADDFLTALVDDGSSHPQVATPHRTEPLHAAPDRTRR